MIATIDQAISHLGEAGAIDAVAGPVRAAAKRFIPPGPVKDLLSGTWLGHPLHPLLTDIPIGSFTSASVLDLIGGRNSRHAADVLIALGLVSAAPTVAAGLADWSDAGQKERRIGAVHATANVAGLALYGLSLRARLHHRRLRGAVLALAGMGVMTVGGYLGGHLSFRRGVGVNAAFLETGPDAWTAVMGEHELVAAKPVVVDAGGAAIMLCRLDGSIFAIGARCPHAGGPLADGPIDEAASTVTCPWHQSVFALNDGSVRHGPATAPAARFETRVVSGQVEVRRAPVR